MFGETSASAHYGAHAHRRTAIEAREIAPDAETAQLLPGAQFADAYRIVLTDGSLDATGAARRMFGRMPLWVGALTALRNAVVAPFGLKPGKPATNQIGIFPVIAQAPDRVVLGLDDRHLDFRLVIDIATMAGGRGVTATTIVKTHNRLGRAYLAAILPFHRIIARTAVRQAAVP